MSIKLGQNFTIWTIYSERGTAGSRNQCHELHYTRLAGDMALGIFLLYRKINKTEPGKVNIIRIKDGIPFNHSSVDEAITAYIDSMKKELADLDLTDLQKLLMFYENIDTGVHNVTSQQ